ncbi:synaptosomal-associated protein 29 [Narcine bancroftii]|uniref:synaptosomal-associated protein 29 n=1 Tax=Narcine bancroftii TaxID=1343680 RepID=UPI0038318C4F
MSAYPNWHNPFADDDEGEENEGGRFGGPQAGGALPEGNWSDAAERQRYLRQQVLSSAQRAVQSSSRSVALVYESEQVGVDTAEELMRQGDALRRTDKMLDKMDQDLKVSQKHINSIKSIFGGITNYFKFKNPEPQVSPEPEKQTNSKLQETLEKSRLQDQQYQANHPNLRKLDTSGFGAASTSGAVNNNYPKNNCLQDFHKQMDDNLDEISSGLGRLKGLAIGLQTEIDDQDEIIKCVTSKTERVESKIGATNRQLRKL